MVRMAGLPMRLTISAASATVLMQSVWRRDEVLTGGVWDTYLAVPQLLGRKPERVAMPRTKQRATGVYLQDQIKLEQALLKRLGLERKD